MSFSFINVSVRCPLHPEKTETIKIRAADLPDGGVLFPPDYPCCESYHADPDGICDQCVSYVGEHLRSIRSVPGLIEPPLNLGEGWKRRVP